MTYQEFHRHLKSLFVDHWTGEKHVFANEAEEVPVEPVGVKGGAGYPACFFDIDTDFTSSDFLTYDDSEVNGMVRLTLWVEPEAGEDHLMGVVDSLRQLFLDHGDVVGGVDFFEPLVGTPVAVDAFPWYGREVLVPFKRYDER